MNKPSNSLPTLNRRTVFVGAGTAGALGALAAVSALPGAAPEPVKAAESQRDAAGGYQLTDHVKQYYQTARI